MSRHVRTASRIDDGPIDFEPERARRTLSGGVLLFRWVAFVWMLLLNVARPDSFRRPVLAWAGIGAAGLWTVWLTRTRGKELPGTLRIDLAMSVGLILSSGLVVAKGGVQGPGLFYATAYPVSTSGIGQTGTRRFATTDDGVVHADTDLSAAPADRAEVIAMTALNN